MIFYRRFDTHDSSSRFDSVLSNVFVSNADRLEIDVYVVTQLFQHVCSRKATGPDGIPAFLLKTFAEELAQAWCPTFQLSIDSHRVPILWKTSYITPIQKIICPKKTKITDLLHLSIIMKCLERLVAYKQRLDVQDYLEPFQFAYRQGRATYDEELTTLSTLLLCL